MPKNKSVELWLEVSAALLHDLLPQGAGIGAFGQGMAPEAFADLVDREAGRVDHALAALASARDEHEVRSLFAQLARDTTIALFSRWAHYQASWQRMLRDPHPHLWVPPRPDEIWRAVFLAMTGENWHSTETARRLWAELS